MQDFFYRLISGFMYKLQLQFMMYNFVSVWILCKVDHIRSDKMSLDEQRNLLGYYILKIFTGLKKTGKEWQSISCKKKVSVPDYFWSSGGYKKV